MKKFYAIIIIFFLLQINNFSQFKKLNTTKLDYFITVNSPKEGDSLKVGTTKFIQWSTNYSNYSKSFLIEYSTNNGSSWQTIVSTSNNFNQFLWIIPNTPSNYCFIRISKDSIVGYSGVFSIYGKLQWEIQNSIFTSQLNSVFFVDSISGWIAGNEGVLKTTDKGESWYPLSVPVNNVFFDVFFIDKNSGWIVGNGLVCKTTDGGENWNPQASPYSGSNIHFFKVQFLDTQNGYILCEDAVLKTTNSGQLWSVADTSPAAGHILSSMFFVNKDTGWIAGGEGVILKTTDGGLNWIWQLTPETSFSSSFGSIYFIDQKIGWVTGSGHNYPEGVILKTTNGGDNWDLQLDNDNNYRAIYFINYLEGWAVGTNGNILSTNDGGITWIDEGSGVIGNLISLYFLSMKEGWVVGNSGIILKYKFIDPSYVPVELTSFDCKIFNNNTVELNWRTATETNNKGFEIQRKLNSGWEKIGYVSGGGTTTNPNEYNYTDNFKYQSFKGIVSYRLKQIDLDGSFHYSDEIKFNIDFTPKEFTLYQNYPNPFNPSTTIKYALPFESSVDITIYNMIGQRMEKFNEGVKSAGYYNVTWQPKDLSSGVYFYSINAKSTDGKNDYSKTLKMLYMK